MLSNDPGAWEEHRAARQTPQGLIYPAFPIRRVEKHSAKTQPLVFHDTNPGRDGGPQQAATVEQLCSFEVGANDFLRVRTGIDEDGRAAASAQGFYAKPAGPGEQVQNVYIDEGKSTGEDIEN